MSLARDTDLATTTTAGPGGSGPATKTFVRPDIEMKKFTNGVDADTEAEAPQIAPGDLVTWTYKVTNTGEMPFTFAQIVITDDAGTPGNPGDDFSTTSGDITFQSVLVGDADNILEPGEMWVYEARDVAQDLADAGPAVTFDFSGSSALDGADGNIRTFTAGGISVKASAFSRRRAALGRRPTWAATGADWALPTPRRHGGSNSHTVDNIGRDNYVLFEFSETVVVDSAFLGYVVGDSDLRVWIGTTSRSVQQSPHAQRRDV